MAKALYRKYRSKSLKEIVGQEHVTTTLANALQKGTVSHAYLLTGPRGVGKTSIARILAHEVNELPYSDDVAEHLDIIEIDAASNNGVENVRDLREKAYVAPSSAKYKVYIIDEVHMLSKPAFNALLKILEEPPAHVIFILATTEVHKLPETIVSRTQRFTLKPIEHQSVIDHLRQMAKSEGIKISDDALALVAEHGGGSFRDSISLLDQIGNTGSQIERTDVERVLGIAPTAALDTLLEAIKTGSTQAIVQTITELRSQGYQAAQLSRQLAGILRHQLIEGTNAFDRAVLTRSLKALLEVPAGHDPETAFEIALIELALQIDSSEPAPVAMPKQTVVAQPTTPAPASVVKPVVKAVPEVPPEVEEPDAPAPEPDIIEDVVPATPAAELQAFDAAIWAQVLDAIKKHHNTLYSCARMATPSIDGSTLTLAFGFPFHQKKMNDAKPKALVAQIVQDLTGQEITVSCIVQGDRTAPVAAAATEPPKATSQSIETISNIFGGAEVLES